MKKRVSVLLFTALLMASTVFMACSNGTTEPVTTTENSFSTSNIGTGKVIGLVIDNRGNPVEDATVTLGSKQVKTNSGGEYLIEDVSVNDLIGIGATPPLTNVTDTAFYLTAVKKDKDGKDLYLPAKSTAIYVSYIDQETEASKAYIAELNALVSEYSTLLKAYAAALEAGGAMNTDINVNAITDSAEMTNTKTVYSDANEVFKVIADAIASIKDKIKNRDFSRSFCSDFANLTMIPLDASFAGSVRLNLTAKTENTTIISEKTYIPSYIEGDEENKEHKVVVRATYLPNGAGTGENYHWDATLDETGRFKFEGLPSGVDVTFSIDSFVETIGSNVYVFSSESSDLIVENSQADDVFAKIDSTAGTPATVTLDTISGQKSAVFMLYAQNDKIWVTDTSVKDSTGAKLLDTKAPITFTFSKPMFKVDIVPVASASPAKTNIKDVDEKNVTLTWSADGKTATFTPNDGNWNTTGDVAFVLVGEAKDGATTILNSEFEAYFDTDIWIGLKVEGEATETIVKSFDDVDGLLALDAPIVLTFSKEMTEYVELDIKYKTTTGYASIPNLYNKEWTDKNTLKITPVTYWDIPAGNALLVSVKKAKAVDGTDTPKYWKLGVIEDDDGNALGLGVNFDNYVDVSLADASTASLEQFTITFSKALKAFDGKDDAFDTEVDITIVDSSDTAIDDFITEIDETKKIITVKAKDNVFATKGKYKITLSDNVVAVDGSQLFRKPGNKKEEEDKTFETDFGYKGFNLRPISMRIIDTLPSTAELSRGVQTIVTTPDKVLEITFTKQIANSTIQICNDPDDTNTIVSAKNYIDTVNPKIVYIPLNEIKQVGAKDKEVKALVLKMADNVTAIDGTTIEEEPSDDNYEEWLGYAPAFNIYAAMTLEGSSLIKTVNTASDKINCSPDNTINIGDDITFTFSSKPDTVHYTLYIDDGNGKIDFVSEGKTGDTNATIAFKPSDDKTVVIKTSKLISNLDYANNDRVTTYYIDLAALKGGVQVFNTTNSYFPSTIDGTFEKDGISAVYKSTDDTGLSCGTVEVKVNPILLEGTNLVDTLKGEVVTVDAKEAVTFDFSTSLTGYTAEYKLLKGTATLEVDDATISGSTVTVQSDKLVIDNDNANTDRTTSYEIVLNIKDADGVVVFSTENKFPSTMADTFEADLDATNGTYANAIVGTNGGIKVNVNPVLLEGTNLVDTEKDEVVGVDAKAAVTFDFNTTLTGYTAKYKLIEIEDPTAAATPKTIVKEGNATISGSTVTVLSNKLVVDNDNVNADRTTSYEIVLTITDANGVVVFSTENNFPSAIAGTFEADLDATNGTYANAIVGTNGGIKVNVNPVLLTGTNLVDAEKEEIIDVNAKAAVTFDFNTVLTGYTAKYKLIKIDPTGAQNEIAVKEGNATISGSTVTVQSDKLIIDNDFANTADRTTSYEIVLTITDANDVVVFSTENNFPSDISGTFEADLVAANGNFASAIVGTNGGITVNVKPILLAGTNLVDTDEEKVLDVEAKAAVTFTFDTALTGYTAEYDLLDATGSSVDSGDATISGSTVTVQNNKMIIDTATAPAATGLTQYEIVLTIKDADDNVAFTTASNFPIDAEESLEEKMVAGGTYNALVGSNDGIKFNVKPITIEEIAVLLEEGTTFGDANGTFSAKAPVLPGSAITIKFSSALPVGAKVEYEVFEMNSSSVLEALGGDNAEKALPLLTAATDTITISSTDMVADVADDKYYYILIRVKKGEEILFTTESNFFGAASDYEAALNTAGFVDTTNGKLKVKVVESKVITFANDNTSVTTTSADFQESFKSNIVLQFTHPVTGYKAVLYDDTAKIFTKHVNAATQFTALSSTAPVSTYDEWTAANEEYIYASTATVSGNVITITPTNYFSANKTIKIAIFNANDEFVDVKFDDNNALAYTTAPTWDISEAIATATVKAPNTAADEIGNGAAVKFEFDTAYSSVTNSLAKYTIYVKNAETDTYSVSTAATEGVDENGTSLAGTAGVTTYRLGRAAKTYVSTAALDDDAFKYGGIVNVAIVKELDGVKTVYKAELVDGKASTLNITTTPGTVISGFTQINTSDPTGLKTNTTGVALACDNTTTNQAQNIDFVLNITSNEWIKTITATVTGQENTNAGLGSSDHKSTVANPVVTYSTANPTTATITFDDAYWYVDDTISITVKDTSNNEVTYTITIK